MELRRKTQVFNWVPLFLAVFYFFASILFVNPLGEFPINDDPFYAYSAKKLVESGKFDFFGMSVAPYVPLLIYALVIKICGFSFVTLRFANLVFAFFCIPALFLVLREIPLNRSTSGIFCLVLAINPLFLHLSFNCMTDIIFLFFVELYMLFGLKMLKQKSICYLTFSSVFLCLAILSRQTAVVFVLGNLFVAFFVLRENNVKTKILGALFFVLLPFTVYCLSQIYFQLTNENLDFYKFHGLAMTRQIESLFKTPIKSTGDIILQIGEMCFYFGLFFLPLIPYMIHGALKSRNIYCLCFSAGMTGFVFWQILIGNLSLMPFNLNLLRISEIGPGSILGSSMPAWSALGLWLLTCVAGLCSFFLIYALTFFIYRVFLKIHSKYNVNSLFAVFALVSIAGVIVIQVQIFKFDRYYLNMIIPALVFVAYYIHSLRLQSVTAVTLVLTLSLACYSAMHEQHFMSWNRARWQAIHSLWDKGVNPESIDGGFEYAHRDHLDFKGVPDLKTLKMVYPKGSFGRPPQDKWRFWAVSGDEYVIAHVNTQNYKTIFKVPYWSSIGNTLRYVLVEKRSETE